MNAPKFQRRSEDRPREICSAALDLFAERGFAGTRVDDIAARAGVSKGTLYLYFKDKEEIFSAVVRNTVAPNIAMIRDSIAAVDMARILFGVPMEGGWAALIIGLFLFIVGSLSLGFLVSTVARTQLQAMQMAVFYLLPSILLTGFLFPFRGMPQWAQWIGTAIPVTHMLRVVRGSMLKGVGIGDALPSLGALTLFVLIVASIAVRKYRTTLD